MTLRAVILGLLIGLLISTVTYFNDHVMHQTQLIGSFLPISVFGLILCVLLLANPLLRCLGKSAALRAGEILVALAIALAACGYPGSNCFRYFTSISAMPAHLISTQTAWQSHHLLSYVPNASYELAQGQVADWPALARAVDRARSQSSPGIVGRLYLLAEPADQRLWRRAFAGESMTSEQIDQLTHAINRVLADRQAGDVPSDLDDWQVVRFNRTALDRALPNIVIPPPRGGGILAADGRNDPHVTSPLVSGLHTGELLPVKKVPWSAWWTYIRLWGGAVVLLGLASLCMAVIVHPQWSRRELLPYPIARFAEQIVRRDDGAFWPQMARNRMFWIGFGALMSLHLVNGVHAWFSQFPQIPMSFDFTAMRQLFPNASRVAQSWTLFHPTLYLSVVAFTFMLNRSTSLTLGLAPFIFAAIGAVFIANGSTMLYDKFTPNKMNMIRLGAYIGLTAMVLYSGRRYYLSVCTAALRGHRPDGPQRSAIWAARLMLLAIGGGIALLVRAGMSPLMAVILVAMCLMIWLVMARVTAETGMFLISGPFLPLGVLPALLGYEALGPTQIILLGLGGFLLLGDAKEALMPFIVNALHLTDHAKVRTSRITPIMVGMVVVGFAIALIVTLGLQYEHGVDPSDGYANVSVVDAAFGEAVRGVSTMASQGTLAKSVAMDDWGRLASISPDLGSVGWLAAGLALVIAIAVARLRFSWWPIHPVLFVVMGTWGMSVLGFSCLIGWMIKSAVVSTGGSRSYQKVLPLMIGVIAGELSGGLVWMIVGGIYYLCTGLVPAQYAIFP